MTVVMVTMIVMMEVMKRVVPSVLLPPVAAYPISLPVTMDTVSQVPITAMVEMTVEMEVMKSVAVRETLF